MTHFSKVNKAIDAHICQYGVIKGIIRPYPSLLCSICGGREAVEIIISREEMTYHNDNLRKEINYVRRNYL